MSVGEELGQLIYFANSQFKIFFEDLMGWGLNPLTSPLGRQWPLL